MARRVLDFSALIFIILIVSRAAAYEIYALTIPFHSFPFELALPLTLLATAMYILHVLCSFHTNTEQLIFLEQFS